MTVIAYRAGVLAADRQQTRGSIFSGETTKIARRPSDGALIGCAGNGSLASSYRRWFVDGEQGVAPSFGDDNDSAGALIVWPDGRVEERDRHGSSFPEGEYFAVGCGSDLALVAMDFGATAAAAVAAACKRDIHCGGGIDVLYLDAARVVALKE